MKKIIPGIVFIAALGISAAQAQSTAPGGDTTLPKWLQYHSPYAGRENDIANPHRTTDEIETWAEETAADVLTFNKYNYGPKMETFKKYFVPSGWAQYTDYLKSSHIIEMVGTDNYAIGAIVDEKPLVINQGAVDGAYNWILRMPVTVSFFTKDAATDTTKTGPSGKFYLFLDITRVAGGGNSNGISITNWRMENSASAHQ